MLNWWIRYILTGEDVVRVLQPALMLLESEVRCFVFGSRWMGGISQQGASEWHMFMRWKQEKKFGEHETVLE